MEKGSPQGSKLIKNLERYNYLPDPQTIDKMKYYLGPYNEIKGFRKYMELSPSAPPEDSDPWDKVSRYILYNKEGILKKYTNPVYMPLKDVESDDSKEDKNKANKKTKTKLFQLLLARKKLGSKRRDLNNSACEFYRENSIISTVTPVSLADPKIRLPKRRNESLFTPVRKNENKDSSMNKCFSTAINWNNQEDTNSISSDDESVHNEPILHSISPRRINFAANQNNSITEDSNDLSTSGNLNESKFINIESIKRMNVFGFDPKKIKFDMHKNHGTKNK